MDWQDLTPPQLERLKSVIDTCALMMHAGENEGWRGRVSMEMAGGRVVAVALEFDLGPAEAGEAPAPLVEPEPEPDAFEVVEAGPPPVTEIDLEMLRLSATGLPPEDIAAELAPELSGAEVARKLRELRSFGGNLVGAQVALRMHRQTLDAAAAR